MVLDRIAALEDATLARQLAELDALIADPVAQSKHMQTKAITSHPEVFASRADAIMSGLERAVSAASADNRFMAARTSGRLLAGLIADLPRERFIAFGPRILSLYARAQEKHWLWEVDSLGRRLGNLGPDALPYLINKQDLPLKGWEIEGLCRVGTVGREVAEPALLNAWKGSGRISRDRLAEMFIAMRRIGISPPPMPEGDRARLADLETKWADISPQSPPRVCAVAAEWAARLQEQRSGTRQTNIE